MKKIIVLLLICSQCIIAIAQQLPLNGLNSQYDGIFNPGSVPVDNLVYGYENRTFVSAVFRKQWVDLPKSPVTACARIERYFNDRTMTVGMHLLSDKTYPTGLNGLGFRYAYRFGSDVNFLSMGLSASLYQYRFKGDETMLRDAYDDIGLESVNKLFAEFSLGAMFQSELYNGNIFYAGGSIPQLTSVNIDTSGQSGDFYSYRVNHYQATAGYITILDNGGSTSEASFVNTALGFYKAAGSPVKAIAKVQYQIAGYFWVGCGYAASFQKNSFNQDDLRLEGGVIFGNKGAEDHLFKISYGYEQSFSPMQAKMGPSHEFGVSVMF